MVDFSSLLRKPAGEAVRPMALPMGDYQGVITGREFGDNNRNKTPYVRVLVKPTQWPDSVDPEDRLDTKGNPIDLSKRTMRRDYYLTDEALYRLDDLLNSCGLKGQEYEELLPQLVGKSVIIEVQQYINQNTSEIGNQVGKLIGLDG